MLTLPTLPEPNQNFQVFIENRTWGITLKVFENGSAFVSVTLDNVSWCEALRATLGRPIFFSNRLAQYGQLALVALDGSTLVDPDKLGDTQFLLWIDPA